MLRTGALPEPVSIASTEAAADAERWAAQAAALGWSAAQAAAMLWADRGELRFDGRVYFRADPSGPRAKRGRTVAKARVTALIEAGLLECDGREVVPTADGHAARRAWLAARPEPVEQESAHLRPLLYGQEEARQRTAAAALAAEHAERAAQVRRFQPDPEPAATVDPAMCDHERYVWLYLTADRISRRLGYHLACECGAERNAYPGGAPAMNIGTKTRPLGIRDADTGTAQVHAERCGYSITGLWSVLDEHTKRAPVTADEEPVSWSAVDDPNRRPSPAPSPAVDQDDEQDDDEQPTAATPTTPPGLYVVPLVSTRWRERWGVECGRCVPGVRTELPGDWFDRAEAEEQARAHFDLAHRSLSDVLTPEEIAEARRWSFSALQTRLLGWIENGSVSEFEDGFWALDVSPDRWDVNKKVPAKRFTDLWAAGLAAVYAGSPGGPRGVRLTDTGRRVFFLWVRARRQGEVTEAPRDVRPVSLPGRAARAYPLMSRGEFFANEPRPQTPAAESTPQATEQPTPAVSAAAAPAAPAAETVTAEPATEPAPAAAAADDPAEAYAAWIDRQAEHSGRLAVDGPGIVGPGTHVTYRDGHGPGMRSKHSTSGTVVRIGRASVTWRPYGAARAQRTPLEDLRVNVPRTGAAVEGRGRMAGWRRWSLAEHLAYARQAATAPEAVGAAESAPHAPAGPDPRPQAAEAVQLPLWPLPVASRPAVAVGPVVVVPCSAGKLPHAAPAGQLYTGSLHAMCRRAADQLTAAGGTVLILSARYGLVTPDEVIEPYDVRMGDPGSVTPDQLRAQAARYGLADAPTVTILAGRAYTAAACAVWPHAAVPLEGVRGIGEMRHRLANLANPAQTTAA